MPCKDVKLFTIVRHRPSGTIVSYLQSHETFGMTIIYRFKSNARRIRPTYVRNNVIVFPNNPLHAKWRCLRSRLWCQMVWSTLGDCNVFNYVIFTISDQVEIWQVLVPADVKFLDFREITCATPKLPTASTYSVHTHFYGKPHFV